MLALYLENEKMEATIVYWGCIRIFGWSLMFFSHVCVKQNRPVGFWAGVGGSVALGVWDAKIEACLVPSCFSCQFIGQSTSLHEPRKKLKPQLQEEGFFFTL